MKKLKLNLKTMLESSHPDCDANDADDDDDAILDDDMLDPDLTLSILIQGPRQLARHLYVTRI